MDQTKMSPQKGIVERNILLTGQIMRFLMDNPQVFNSLPEKFELVILPDDDPDIRQCDLQQVQRKAHNHALKQKDKRAPLDASVRRLRSARPLHEHLPVDLHPPCRIFFRLLDE